MFPPKSLKGVTKSARNLPPEPIAADVATAPEPPAGSLTCPSCGAPFTLSATAAPSAEPPVVEPVPVVVDDERAQRF